MRDDLSSASLTIHNVVIPLNLDLDIFIKLGQVTIMKILWS